jgi:hypothetical protein
MYNEPMNAKRSRAGLMVYLHYRILFCVSCRTTQSSFICRTV